MRARRSTLLVAMVAITVVACRQIVGIDESRPVMGGDASTAGDSGSGGHGGADGAQSGAEGGDVDDATSADDAFTSNADASSLTDAHGEDDGSVACTTTGTADRRFVQWRLPAISPPTSSYIVTTDTALDSVTGLMWERNPPASEGDPTGAIARCQTVTAGGFSDWRVPTRIELLSILDYEQSPNLINPAVIGKTAEGAQAWTLSVLDVTTPVLRQGRFVVDLEVSATPIIDPGQAEAASVCVRAGCVASVPSRFVVGSSSARDAVTGLSWQRGVSPTASSFADAGSYCTTFSADGLGSGWRLPTIRELASLFDETRTSFPLIDTTTFSGGDETWSATAVGAGSPNIYTVNFADQTNNYILDESPCEDSTCNGETPFPARCVHD